MESFLVPNVTLLLELTVTLISFIVKPLRKPHGEDLEALLIEASWSSSRDFVKFHLGSIH